MRKVKIKEKNFIRTYKELDWICIIINSIIGVVTLHFVIKNFK